MTRTTVPDPNPPLVDVEILRLQKRIEKLKKERDRVGSLLAMDDPFEDREVIIFHKKMSRKNYTYVAVKVGSHWYVTGDDDANKKYTWRSLVQKHFTNGVSKVFRVADVQEVTELTDAIFTYRNNY